jgi:hypothetical protein
MIELSTPDDILIRQVSITGQGTNVLVLGNYKFNKTTQSIQLATASISKSTAIGSTQTLNFTSLSLPYPNALSVYTLRSMFHYSSSESALLIETDEHHMTQFVSDVSIGFNSKAVKVKQTKLSYDSQVMTTNYLHIDSAELRSYYFVFAADSVRVYSLTHALKNSFNFTANHNSLSMT